MPAQNHAVGWLCLLVAVLGTAGRATADVVASAAHGFEIRCERQINASPNDIYAAVLKIGEWWSDAHTFSGSAKNMSLDLEKARLEEKLPEGGFVRHLDVVFHQPGRILRLAGGLGPLQGMGLSGALTIGLTPDGQGTRVLWSYHVHGFAAQGLESLAPIVDQVLTEQLMRLADYCTASPEVP